MKKLNLFTVLFTMLFVFCQTAYTQVTTSSVSGRISDERESLPGATVRAIHVPSGTVYGTVTNVEGRYNLSGMRAGGPYYIEVSFVGYTTDYAEHIALSLGENYIHNVSLKNASVSLGEVVITGQSRFQSNRTGAALSMNAVEISRVPSITSSVAEVIRFNPQVTLGSGGAMSFAGTNNRYNSFQVDGAVSNDNFGLTASGVNGGQAGAQPISMEAIEQIQIAVAPFDVRQSGFTGGAVNAITKSGTNTLTGSVFYNLTNQDLMGRYEMKNGDVSSKLGKQSQYRTGFTLGGPIIKDKLFFFANYEKQSNKFPNNSTLGAENSNIDAIEAKKILDEVKSLATARGVTYNGTLPTSFEEYTNSDKAGLKLNWNINDSHKTSIRWNMVAATQSNMTPTVTNLNSSDYMYEFKSNANTFVAELQSRFSNNISNEFRASYVRVRDSRNPYGSPFPMIVVNNVRKADATGAATVNIGNERSSVANRLDQDVWSFTNNLNWYQGNHTLTFGTHNEFFHFANLFIQDNYGTYYFNNPDDFFACKINQYRFQEANVAVTGNPRWEAAFGAGQLGFYAQDRWYAAKNFILTIGLRMDIPLFFDSPAENAPFNEYSAQKGWGYKTNQKLSSTPLWSPRAGFRWTLDENNNFMLRGGIGIFTGRIPFVWLSNNFSNTGIQMATYNTTATSDLSLIVDPNGQADNVSRLAAGGSQTINVFAPDFKFAQNMRVNLGFDFNVGGINWTAEAIYSKTLNDVLYQNLARDVNGKTVAQTYPSLSFDNRPMLEVVTGGTPFTQVFALSNTNEGYSYNLSLQGAKKFDFGLDLIASYAFTQSKSLNSGTSSVAASNWDYNYVNGNPNKPELGFSGFNTPHKINVTAFYSMNFVKSQTTTFGLIYQGLSGAPYSVVYAGAGNFNGDGSASNNLIWIPTDAQVDQMNFRATTTVTADEQKANFKAWLARDPYLSKNRGKYFERYADNHPFEHHFDFHFAHKANFNVGAQQHALELTFDILNVGNMLNTKWGRTHSTPWSYSPITFAGTNAAGDAEFQFLQGPNYDQFNYADFTSRWRGQIGLRYTF